MFGKNKEITEETRTGKMTFKHIGVLIICCLLAAASFGLQSNVAGVYYTPVSDDLGIGRGMFTMHMTILTLACAVITLFVPAIIKLVDYKKLLMGSIVVNAIGTAAMAASSNIYVFYVLGAVRGVAMAFFFSVPITMIINNWFVKSHGLITSLAFSFSGIAGALFSPILTAMISSIGWRLTYAANGVMMLLLGLPGILMNWHLDPAEDGLTAYGYVRDDGEGEEGTERKSGVRASVFSIAFLALFVRAVFVAGITSVAQHFPGYVENIGLYGVTALVLSAAMVGNILFKFVLGLLSDMLGAFRAVVTMIVFTLIGLTVMMLTRDPRLMLLGAFMFGASYSVGSVGAPLLTRTFFGEENYTKIYPPIAFATNVGYSVIMVRIGFIYDYFGNYRVALLLSFAMIAFIFAGLFIARRTSPVERAARTDDMKERRRERKERKKLEKEEKKEQKRREKEEARAPGEDAGAVRDVHETVHRAAPAEADDINGVFDLKEETGISEEDKYDIFKEDLNPHLELFTDEDSKEEFTVDE